MATLPLSGVRVLGRYLVIPRSGGDILVAGATRNLECPQVIRIRNQIGVAWLLGRDRRERPLAPPQIPSRRIVRHRAHELAAQNDGAPGGAHA